MRQRELDKLNRESERLWRSKFEQLPAKVGTVPMTIWVSHEDARLADEGTLSLGTKIYFYEVENGQRCSGCVQKLDPILFLDRF